MPRVSCVACQCELRRHATGIFFVEMTNFGPYKLWHADLWKCPGCGYEAVHGFGDRPLREHYEPDFKEFLDGIKASGKKIIFCYERPVRAQV